MMSSKPIPTYVVFFYLLLIFFCISSSFKLCYSYSNTTATATATASLSCPEIEKQALLKMKQSLDDPSNVLSSWNDEGDCCMWDGVVCSNSTGNVHVHQLHLQGLSGEVNPSLASLRELKYLDLSQNDFEGTIPSFFGFLTSLEYLNISFSGFGGRVPHNIGNLSNLHTLSMEGNAMSEFSDDDIVYVSLDVDSMEWMSGLSGLEYLNMNGVNLSQAANWAEVINALPSLVELHLSSCALSFSTDVNTTSLTKLEYIDLSFNNFESFPMPRWIFQQPNLTFLDLSDCHFEGPIPGFSITTKLKHIDLSNNNINSSIPDWIYSCTHIEYFSMSHSSLRNTISNAIGNLTSLIRLDLSGNKLSGNIPREITGLCKLQYLGLSDNHLEGEISDSFGNMSDCFLEALTSLYLSENQLSGHLTPQFGEFKSLENLYLGDNSISGAIPMNIGKLSSLNYLTLNDNKLTGNLPESLGQLHNLEYLFIQHNMLEGVVTERHFANLSKLLYFTASGNHLTLKVSSDWVPPFQLGVLSLGSWYLGGDVPPWIETQKKVADLDLSNTGISHNIPTWFNWEIQVLYLSHNSLQGEIQGISGPQDGGPRLVYLGSNNFSGSLPRVANNVTELDLSSNSFSGGVSHFLCDPTNATYRLEILHLGGNQLTGELPDCFMKWPSLKVLNLANNNFSGNIPNSIGLLRNLLSLDLYGNMFSGRIPIPIQNCTKLLMLDLGSNGLDGNIPTWMGTSLANLTFLILRSNKLSGEVPSSICHLNALQILDLSDNAFSGVIPRCVDNFTAMATKRSFADYVSDELTYSFYSGIFIESASVDTKGREYQYDKILPLVTNIDLSNNNLSGEIPKELTSLVELRSINFSGNHLAGKIPDRMGDMKQLESLDLSNNSLLGEIPNSFTQMFALNYLNLSFNNLRGRIPSSTQLRGMDASSFTGTDLCGPPLPNNCSASDPVVPGDSGDDDDESTIMWVYIFLSLGYAVGLSAFCTALILNKWWRDAYFGLIDRIWDKFCVF